MTGTPDFEFLCKPASPGDLQLLKRRLATHVDLVAETALVEPALAVDLASRIAEGLATLASNGQAMSPEQRSWVRGAMEYFLLTSDTSNDVGGPDGLDDDRLVFNELCGRLGRPELIID